MWIKHSNRSIKKYLEKNGVEGTLKLVDDKEYGGKRGFKIRVEIDPSKLNSHIPDSVAGVPIEVVESPETAKANCSGTDGRIDPVIGGVENHRGDGSNCFEAGTTWMKMSDSNNDSVMMTAAHIWDACSQTDITGDAAGQADVKYGDIKDFDPQTDWASINPTKSITSLSKILEPNGTERQVVSIVTSSGIDELASTNEPIRQVGLVTGLDEGYVQGSGSNSGDDCIDFDGKGVQCGGINNAQGDSGGPVYALDENGNAEMICMYQIILNPEGDLDCDPVGPCDDVVREKSGTQELRGTAAHHISDKFGFNIVKGV